jgi:putative phage-type endonuclease
MEGLIGIVIFYFVYKLFFGSKKCEICKKAFTKRMKQCTITYEKQKIVVCGRCGNKSEKFYTEYFTGLMLEDHKNDTKKEEKALQKSISQLHKENMERLVQMFELDDPGKEYPFYIVNLEQGTEKWKKWRNMAMGASDASVAVNESFFKDDLDLYAEKVLGEEVELNDAMKRGNRLEPIARDYYNQKTCLDFSPICLISKEYPFMFASLDGITCDYKEVLEIKCGKGAYDYFKRINGIPESNIAQLDHILIVTGLKSIHYLSYHEELEPISVFHKTDQQRRDLVILHQKDFYIRMLVKEEDAAWEDYCDYKIPPLKY